VNNANKYQLVLVALCFLALASGCAATIPKEALQLSNESLEDRRMQTRRFDGATETEILSASAGVLQDLGFQIDESETDLGVIVSSKERDATESAQVAAAIAVALLGGGSMPIDKKQKIRACLVIKPVVSETAEIHNVRITFQRMVWNTQNQLTKIEGLRDPEMYQEFFEKLSKSIFLEANEI
jgi:hypothetical protein